MPRSSRELTAHDLPLQTLTLKVERADNLTTTDLMKLSFVSPLLFELTITLSNSSDIDAVYKMLIPPAVEYERLQSWTIKSHEGFAMSVRSQESTQVGEPDNQTSREIETVKL